MLVKELVKLRFLTGMTQKDLARKAGVYENAVYHLENGKNVNFRILEKLFNALGRELITIPKED